MIPTCVEFLESDIAGMSNNRIRTFWTRYYNQSSKCQQHSDLDNFLESKYQEDLDRGYPKKGLKKCKK